MRFYFILCLLFSQLLFSQTPPILTAPGVEPTVTEVKGMAIDSLYNKSLAWVQTYFNSPDQALKAQINNDMIRVNGFSEGFFKMRSLTTQYYDVEYTLVISFKPERYRFEFYVNNITYNSGPIMFSEKSFFKKKNGEPKSAYSMAIESFNESLKELYLAHYYYITGQLKSDW